MIAWAEWALFAVGAWLVVSFAAAFALARVLSLRPALPAGGDVPGPRRSVAAAEAALRPRILVVDDEVSLRLLLRATLPTDDFDVRDVGSAEDARSVLDSWAPDIVLLDVNLPGADGLSLCAELAGSDGARRPTVILLTGEAISETTARLAGAKALLRKPFSPLALLALVGRLIDEDEFVGDVPAKDEQQLLIYARDLALIARTERKQRRLVQDAYRQTAMALADAVDARDRGTGLHAQRVQRYAFRLAEAVDTSVLDDPSVEYGFLLHDVGKIGIADDVLLKRGPLTADERELVRMHPAIGAQILHNVAMLRGGGLDVVRHHHERWDGAGYPDGLSGEQIPLCARIFAVADTLDAMTTDRPYRSALSWDEAADEIVSQRGHQFDPDIVDAFTATEPRLREIYDGLSLVA
jgi:putative two-component system response regulator